MRSLLSFCCGNLLLLLLVLPHVVSAQIDKAVKWKDTFPANTSLNIGDEITLVFEATIQKGYHIYSAKQPAEFVLPATFELSKTAVGVKAIGALTEAGNREVIYDDVFGANVALFHNKVTFYQKVKITSANVRLSGTLLYQVCDVQQCLPGSHTFSLALKAAAVTAQKRK